MSYSEKLEDPRWQQMRLKVMERDAWACQQCFDTKSTLNVHHLYYERGRDPWDYPDSSLLTLCVECHEAEHHYKEETEEELVNSLRRIGADNFALIKIYSAIQSTERKRLIAPGWDDLADAIKELFDKARRVP